MSAEVVGSAKVELTLDPQQYNAGINRAASRTRILRDEVRKIDLKRIERQADNLAGGLQKVISAARLLTAALAVGSVAAALRAGGDEAVRLQGRLDRVKGAFAGLGERLLRERVFGRQAADWAQAIADGINRIDASKIARLVELVVAMQGLKIGADIFGGLAKVAGVMGAGGIGAGIGTGVGAGIGAAAAGAARMPMGSSYSAVFGETLKAYPGDLVQAHKDLFPAMTKGIGAAVGKITGAFGGLLPVVGKVALIMGALYLASKALMWAWERWTDKAGLAASRAGLDHTTQNLIAAIARSEAARVSDSSAIGLAGRYGIGARTDAEFGRIQPQEVLQRRARLSRDSMVSLDDERAAEQARLQAAQGAVAGAERALQQGRASGSPAALDALQSRLEVAQGRLTAVTQSVTANLASISAATADWESVMSGAKASALALFQHAEEVQAATARFEDYQAAHAVRMGDLADAFSNALKALSPSGASVTSAADQWRGRFEQGILDTAARRGQAERLQEEMVKQQEAAVKELQAARKELEATKNAIDKSNQQADRQEAFLRTVLQQ